MKYHSDRAIVLHRIDYGERDRILSLLCQQQGKVSVLAKSVRSAKSRLAGGIELLSESEITYIDGRSDLKTLTAARLRTHFGRLTQDMRRMQQAFAGLKTVSTIADEFAGQDYYPVLLTMLSSLNEHKYDPIVVELWFNLQVLQLYGAMPDLRATAADRYEFNTDQQAFSTADNGKYVQNDLKLLRLCAHQATPPLLATAPDGLARLNNLVTNVLKTNVTSQ